jgi:hypothetical protein
LIARRAVSMYNRIKHFGAAGLVIIYGCMFGSIALDHFHPRHGYYFQPNSLRVHGWSASHIIPAVLGAWVLLGTIILMVDAFRRNYACERAWPYALALMAPLTLGISVIPYYFARGVYPLLTKKEIYGNEFCSSCLSCSNGDRRARAFFHKLYGMVLLGRAHKCPACKSYIQTLWIFIVVPLIPVGSYRIVPQAPGVFQSRRENFQWAQVLQTIWIWWGALAIFVIWISG